MMKKTTLIALAGLVLLPLSNASYAEDQKVYPGTACRAEKSSDAAGLTTTDFGLFAGQNGVLITCPIVRDNVSNLNGTKAAVVTVFNDNGNVDLSCTLFSSDQFGGRIATKTTFAARFQDELDVDVNASANRGYYSLFCFLPANTGIRSYRINEF